MASKAVWFDIPVRDLDRAIGFYAAVLGAPVHKHEFPGGSLGVLDHSGSDVGGCLVPDPDAVPGRTGPLLYLNAAGRLDDAIAAVEQQGGEVLEPKASIGQHGFRAIVLDSEGNRIALHSP